MMYKLPEPLYSWAWTAEYLAAIEANEEEKTKGGIWLPRWFRESDPDKILPAYSHFSRMGPEGVVSWLWLFPDAIQATALRMFPQMDPREDDPISELVSATIPNESAGPVRTTMLVQVDAPYIASLPLNEMEIQEVWIGFDWKKYGGDRDVRAAVSVLPSDEFLSLLRR